MNEKNYDPFHFTVHIKKPNSIRDLSTTYSNYLKIRRGLQEQKTNNLVTAYFKHLVGTKCFHTIHKPHLCADLIPQSVCSWLLPDALFPFSLSLVQLQHKMLLWWGRKGEKKKGKGGVPTLAYLLLCLHCFCAPLLVNKQWLPLVSYHIISK